MSPVPLTNSTYLNANQAAFSRSEERNYQDHVSGRVLAALCTDGDIEGVQAFLKKTLPSMPRERQNNFCHHLTGGEGMCDDVPCIASRVNLSATAAEGGQANVFVYLWDTFLAPRGIASISWRCLKTAAFQGALPLARAFCLRASDCFKKEPPPVMHPSGAKRSRQVEIAIRSDRFEYIDFMLSHGADINAGGKDLLRMVVNCAVDDDVTLQRVQFLLSRGAKAEGSGALLEVGIGNDIELASCLLDGGIRVDDFKKPEKISSLMVAAREGFEEMIKLLLHHGADTELADREGRDAVAIANKNSHDSVVGVLQAHRSQVERSKTEK